MVEGLVHHLATEFCEVSPFAESCIAKERHQQQDDGLTDSSLHGTKLLSNNYSLCSIYCAFSRLYWVGVTALLFINADTNPLAFL